MGCRPKERARPQPVNRPQAGATRPQPGATRDHRAWREAVNQQSDEAIGRMVRQNGWLPAAADTPPPAVRENGIHVQPQRNPWESLVEAGVPASSRGVQSKATAAAARRGAEMQHYISLFEGHRLVPATTLDVRPPHEPGNPPPPPPETP